MYEDFYGLTQRPFQLTPDPAFYFESTTHKKALSYLGYGLNQGEGFIVITGEVGSGKSTLVAHLKGKLDDRRLTVGEVVTSALDDAQLIHVAARSFGLEIEGNDKATALAAIELFLHEEARDGRRCLLIVDEAQNLSIGALEELRMLSNFQLGAHPLLQTLLLGQPEFKDLLNRSEELEQLRQRVIAAHHLEAMQPGELEPYVLHRLAHADWKGNPAFDASLWTTLHAATGGIPRRVNQVMTRLLLLGAIEQKQTLDAELLRPVLEEMAGDVEAGEDREHAPRPRPDRSALPAAEAVAKAKEEMRGSGPAASSSTDQPGLREAQIAAIEKAFADRDRLLAALRREIESLRSQNEQQSSAQAPSESRMAAIEARLDEQEESLRHVLAMMIDYFETQGTRAAA